MLQFEKSLFEDLMKGIEASDKQVYEMLKGKKQDLEKNELVVFKTNVGEFMGMEGEKIGPFEKGQVANISKEVAAILIEDGKAEVLEK